MFWKNVQVARCYIQEWEWNNWLNHRSPGLFCRTGRGVGCSQLSCHGRMWCLCPSRIPPVSAFYNAPHCWQMDGFGTQRGAILVTINTHYTFNEAGTSHRLVSQAMKNASLVIRNILCPRKSFFLWKICQNEREEAWLLQSQSSTDVLPAILAHAIDLLEQFLSVINDCQQALHEILKWILAVAADLEIQSSGVQAQSSKYKCFKMCFWINGNQPGEGRRRL